MTIHEQNQHNNPKPESARSSEVIELGEWFDPFEKYNPADIPAKEHRIKSKALNGYGPISTYLFRHLQEQSAETNPDLEDCVLVDIIDGKLTATPVTKKILSDQSSHHALEFSITVPFDNQHADPRIVCELDIDGTQFTGDNIEEDDPVGFGAAVFYKWYSPILDSKSLHIKPEVLEKLRIRFVKKAGQVSD